MAARRWSAICRYAGRSLVGSMPLDKDGTLRLVYWSKPLVPLLEEEGDGRIEPPTFGKRGGGHRG